ncbi:MAG: HAMP domain-containing sensor histidine kinase [Bacilli bacterium]
MKDYIKNIGLRGQLLVITIITIILSSFTLILLVPKLLMPFYEYNIYEMLKQPLPFIKPGISNNNENIAYIIESNAVVLSNNFNSIMKTNNYNDVLSKISKTYGSFKLNGRKYYYNTSSINNAHVVTLTNNNYILSQQKNLNNIIMPITMFILLITVFMLMLYSDFIVRKISKIKKKIDNIDNNNFNHSETFSINDELNSLNNSIEKTRLDLIEKEEYKNNMFQSISHELKTPIMVISSHVEASEDKVISKNAAIKVIKDEAKNLNNQVEQILKLNKINYLKNEKSDVYDSISINKIVRKSIRKFKLSRKDCAWSFTCDKSKFRGNDEDWQTIIDNILNNFSRFAIKNISITIKNNTIIMFNDGPLIEKNIIDDVFVPYKKGTNGKHGLGLTIVNDSLKLFGYKIEAKNIEDDNKQGVVFIIK